MTTTHSVPTSKPTQRKQWSAPTVTVAKSSTATLELTFQGTDGVLFS